MNRLYEQSPGPLHMINIALNLVKGDNLAWQQRKAQSFTISPLHSGSWNLGYRRSEEYGANRYIGQPLSLGTALAISGAAASPNMGYHSSSAVTFLLALFNIRLGWWLGNPGPAGMTTTIKPHPRSRSVRCWRKRSAHRCLPSLRLSVRRRPFRKSRTL